jgi:hypothetical protein
MPRSAVFASVVALVALAGPAEAQFLALRLEAPGFAEATKKALDQAMREELVDALPVKTRLLPPPAVDYESLKTVTGCPDDGPACLASIGRTANARELLRVVVAGTPTEAQVSIVLVEVATGRARTVVGELLEVGVESGPELRSLVAQVFGAEREPPPGRLAPYVASSVGRLDAAELLLDEKRVEVAELERVPSGKHRLEVRQKGFEPFIWVGTVRPNRETRVGVNLVPSGATVAVVTPPIARAPEGPGARTSPPASAASDVEPSPLFAEPAPPSPSAVRTESTRGPSYVGPIVVGGAALGVLVFGIVQGARMRSLQSDLEGACGDVANQADCLPNACDSPSGRFAPECSDARSAETLANVGLIGGGVLAAGAVTWALVELFSGHGVAAPGAARLDVGPGRAAVRVAF